MHKFLFDVLVDLGSIEIEQDDEDQYWEAHEEAKRIVKERLRGSSVSGCPIILNTNDSDPNAV